MKVVFQIRDDNVAVSEGLPQQARLRADMLDVVMPIETGRSAADSLRRGVAVGQGIGHQQHRLCGVELPRGRSDDGCRHARLNVQHADLLLELPRRMKKG